MKHMVRRFHWRCDDCRLRGRVDIRLPVQVRRLHDLLEADHARQRGLMCCPSNYFEITNVSAVEKGSKRRKLHPVGC